MTFKKIELTHDFINDLSSREEFLFGTYCWLNVLPVRKMERKLRKAGGVPFYYGFAEFDLDHDTVVFRSWPLYYKYSYRFRRTQLKRRFGKWLFGIAVRLRK